MAMISTRLLTSLALLFAVALPGNAEEVALRADESTVAVVTHKGGFAAAKAHNHLIVAEGYEATLVFDPESPLAARFELAFAAESLVVDPWEQEQALYPRLEELGVLDEPFSEVAAKDRAKIRKSMLGDKQLDAAKHPRISARLVGVEESSSTLGGVEFPYAAKLALEVHGERVERPIAARFEVSGDTLKVEAVGTFRFTDFGIEPFSAFFGAVKNEDELHVYLHLTGALPTVPDSDDPAP